jgi:hypothetical protein
VWDPIGVKVKPNAQDEYDCCLGSLFHRLTTGVTDDQIAQYLWRQGTEHMGLSLQKDAMYPTFAALRPIALPENQPNWTLDTGC